MPTTCSGDHEAYRKLRVGASWGGFATTLRFSGEAERVGDGDMRQHAVVASLDLPLGEKTTLMGTLGAALGGRFEFGPSTYDVRPGPVVGVAVGHRFVDGRGALPFVLGTASLAASFLSLEHQGQRYAFTAADARVGVIVGKTFGPVSPYALLRAFGGPIFWNDLTGTDRYHYNVGLGFLLGPFGGFDLGAEASFLGERRLTATAGLSF